MDQSIIGNRYEIFTIIRGDHNKFATDPYLKDDTTWILNKVVDSFLCPFSQVPAVMLYLHWKLKLLAIAAVASDVHNTEEVGS